MTASSAVFAAVSPVRALLTGEGMVPQVNIIALSESCCLHAYDQQRQCADALSLGTILFARRCRCVQMLLQQASPQLLCLLLQLLSISSQQSDVRHEESGAFAEVCSRVF